MDMPMIRDDRLSAAEEWALAARRRRPYGSPAALQERLLADAICTDLEHEAFVLDLFRDQRETILDAVTQIVGAALRLMMLFFACVGLFVLLAAPLGKAVTVASLLTAGGAAYRIWEELL